MFWKGCDSRAVGDVGGSDSPVICGLSSGGSRGRACSLLLQSWLSAGFVHQCGPCPAPEGLRVCGAVPFGSLLAPRGGGSLVPEHPQHCYAFAACFGISWRGGGGRSGPFSCGHGPGGVAGLPEGGGAGGPRSCLAIVVGGLGNVHAGWWTSDSPLLVFLQVWLGFCFFNPLQN